MKSIRPDLIRDQMVYDPIEINQKSKKSQYIN
jgi:hypothetical protein